MNDKAGAMPCCRIYRADCAINGFEGSRIPEQTRLVPGAFLYGKKVFPYYYFHGNIGL